MANIKFFIKGNKEQSTINIRFYKGKEYDFKKATPLKTHYAFFKNGALDLKLILKKHPKLYKENVLIQNKLEALKTTLIQHYNSDYEKGIINKEWLNNQIHDFFNIKNKEDKNLLIHYFDDFIQRLPNAKNRNNNNKNGVEKATLRKYTTIKNHLIKFEKNNSTKIYLKDVDINFGNDFCHYLLQELKLSKNTIARYIKFLKTVIKDAQKHKYDIDISYKDIEGYNIEKTQFIYLNEDEIKQIMDFDTKNTPFLNNAKKWFLIGLHTGTRVKDLLNLTLDNFDLKYLRYTSQKTKTKTVVPISNKIRPYLNTNDFPHKISDVKFNQYIKELCKRIGFTKMTKGAKKVPITINGKKEFRKKQGTYPKYELVVSHTMRRSFCTNLFGKVPTPLIMSASGHKSERVFLNYIGKTSEENAEALLKFWDKIDF